MPPNSVTSIALLALLLVCPRSEQARAQQPTATKSALNERIEAAVDAVLARTGVPSASIAIVRKEALYAQAYGNAQLSPQRRATPSMRYAVGSISKEFTAAALLLLQESGKLSIDDAAGKWLNNLGPAAGASIRSLLSHTAGIRDFWPQDYDFPEMRSPIEPAAILARWANQPLDFATGTAWQYSNTGYTVAGLIAERVAGEPLFEFLQARIFKPLGMASVVDFDAGPLSAADASGYMRYALGPPRPAAKEGRGWLFAAGELAMTASDLARWDMALIKGKVLSAASLKDLTTEIRLENGTGTSYALGLYAAMESGRRVLHHGGEVGGFTSENRIFPEDGTAIVVFTNEDATDASSVIADAIEDLVFEVDSPADATALAQAREVFKQLQLGRIDTQQSDRQCSKLFQRGRAAGLQVEFGSARRARKVHAGTVRTARRIRDPRL